MLRGSGDAFADEVDEAGDVLEAAGGGGAWAEDADALPCGLGEPGVRAGAGDHRLVPDVGVDDVPLAAAFVAFPADQTLTLEERARLGDRCRADLETPGELGRGEAALVRDGEGRQHPRHHLRQAGLHDESGERLLVLTHRLGITSVALRRRLLPAWSGLPALVGAAFGGAVGQVGTVGGRTAVPHHLTRDRRGRAVETPGDLRVGEPVGQPQRDLLAVLLGEPASRHRDLLRFR